MTRKEAEKYIKSKMCYSCGVYLGGGKCSDNCNVIETIKALSQEPCEDAKEIIAMLNILLDNAKVGCADITAIHHVSIDSFKFVVEQTIKALSQSPCNTCKHYESRCTWLPNKQSCDDMVSREVVRQGMLKYGFTAPDMTVHEFVEDELPSVTPSRHKGRWIKGINTYFNIEAYRCSECNYHTVYKHDICPNCKTEMVESQEESEKEE